MRPGDLNGFVLPSAPALCVGEEEEEDDDAECLPTLSLPAFEPLVLWRNEAEEEAYALEKAARIAAGEDGSQLIPPHRVEVVAELASKLRPHQREGVLFLFQCTMGLRGFEGQGCILADDMGLGKTLMSITLIWTLMNQSMVKGEAAVRKVVVACPTTLVGNWDNEIKRWVGERCTTFPVKAEPKIIIRNFVQHRGKGVLIISYETQRRYSKMFEPSKINTSCCCDLLICDEAHKLKNADSGLSKSLSLLPAKKRVLLSGTPMQNELTEFFNMVNFCNPGVLGTHAEFRRKYERPILASREPDVDDLEHSITASSCSRLSTSLS